MEPPRSFPRGSEVHGLDALIAAAADEDGIRLLLVGPADDRRELLRDTLEIAGYKVVAVGDPELARDVLARTIFDVAITTLMSPEVPDAIVAATPEVPVVVCAATPIRGLLLLTAVRDAVRARYA